jgi:PBSX family phage terminase large subunit
MQITYSRSIFNPLFWHLKKWNADPSVRRILVYGGSSSGKSHTFCQLHSIMGVVGEKYSTAIFRKEQAVIKDTIKPEVDEVITRAFDAEGIRDLWERLDFEYRTKDKKNRIRFKGLDNPSKIKGMKGFKKVYLDEVDQFKEEEWTELGRRLRGEDNQQIHASWNPVSENHWVKKWIDSFKWIDLPLTTEEGGEWSKLHESSFVRRSEDGRTILIKTTYLDNKWIVGGEVDGRKFGRVDDQVIAEFEEMRVKNPDEYMVYGLGEWGQVRNNSPFFPTLRANCFDEFPLDEDYNLILAFDFNVDECAAVALQVIEDYGIRIYGKYTAYGGIRELCNLIKHEIPLDDYHVIITGDASGANGNAGMGIKASTRAKKTMYNIIAEVFEMRITRKQFVHRKANPRHKDSYELMSDVFWRIPVVFNKGTEQLYDECFSARLADKIDSIQLYKNEGKGIYMNLVDALRYGIDTIFPRGVGSKDLQKGTVRKMYNLVKENNPEMLLWHMDLPFAHKRDKK